MPWLSENVPHFQLNRLVYSAMARLGSPRTGAKDKGLAFFIKKSANSKVIDLDWKKGSWKSKETLEAFIDSQAKQGLVVANGRRKPADLPTPEPADPNGLNSPAPYADTTDYQVSKNYFQFGVGMQRNGSTEDFIRRRYTLEMCPWTIHEARKMKAKNASNQHRWQASSANQQKR